MNRINLFHFQTAVQTDAWYSLKGKAYFLPVKPYFYIQNVHDWPLRNIGFRFIKTDAIRKTWRPISFSTNIESKWVVSSTSIPLIMDPDCWNHQNHKLPSTYGTCASVPTFSLPLPLSSDVCGGGRARWELHAIDVIPEGSDRCPAEHDCPRSFQLVVVDAVLGSSSSTSPAEGVGRDFGPSGRFFGFFCFFRDFCAERIYFWGCRSA